jgi:hypothetical protein
VKNVAAAAAGLPKKPVDIVCESSEFSVDRRWMKLERNTPQLAASCVSLNSHNSPLRRIPGMPHTTNQLERFPLIHSDHHNNKLYWCREVNLKTISELKSCSDDVVDKSLLYAVAGTTPLDYGSLPLHRPKSALGLFTSLKSEYSTAAARSSIKRH